MEVFLKKSTFFMVIFAALSGCAGPNHGGRINDASSMIRVAEKARKTGNPDASVSFYNRALELDKNNAKAYLGLAENYIDKNLLDAAGGYISKAEQNGCDKKRSNYLRGKIALVKGNAAEAEKFFLKSNSIDAMNALGTIYDEKGEHKKAQDMYKKVIAMDPNYIDAYNNLGLSLLLDQKYKDAVFYLENACSLPEANVTYRSNLALAYGMCGDITKARSIYAEDFEGDVLEEKVGYLEALLAATQMKRRYVNVSKPVSSVLIKKNQPKKQKTTPRVSRNRVRKK